MPNDLRLGLINVAITDGPAAQEKRLVLSNIDDKSHVAIWGIKRIVQLRDFLNANFPPEATV